MLEDDAVWRRAFLEFFLCEPPHFAARRPLPTTMRWRDEYLQRMRRRRPWDGSIGGLARRAKQLGCYRFRDVGGVCAARMSLDRKSLIVLSRTGLIAGRIESDAHLRRSALFFPADPSITAGEMRGDALMLGHADGSIKYYQNMPRASVTTGFVLLAAPVSVAHSSFVLPVQTIDWIDQHRALVLYRDRTFPTSMLVLWDLNACTMVQSATSIDIRCWCIVDDTLYWSSGTTVCTQSSSISLFPVLREGGPSHMFPFGPPGMLCVIAARECGELMFIQNGVMVRRERVTGNGGTIVACAASPDTIVCGDERGRVYRIQWMANPVDVDALPNAGRDKGRLKLKITRIEGGPLPARIKDVALDDTIIAVLTEDALAVYDGLSLQVLQSLPIPVRCRRVSGGADLDGEDGRLAARIRAIDAAGRILVQWGQRTLHLWNVGRLLPQLRAPRHPSTDRSARVGRGTDVTRDLEEELDAYVDAREEAQQMNRIVAAFVVEGMTEAEMLQYAQLLSLEDSHSLPVPVPVPVPVPFSLPASPELRSSDPDLELALGRSLEEM